MFYNNNYLDTCHEGFVKTKIKHGICHPERSPGLLGRS